jgi:Holliday junction resolvase RusA-like endonuclease
MTNPTRYSLTIQGHNPAPQGSKRYAGHQYNAKAGRELPVLKEESARVGPWRGVVTTMAVAAASRQRLTVAMDGYLEASIVFIMDPTQKALREIAQQGVRNVFPSTQVYGDIDKLQRSTLDGLKDARVIKDDARVISVQAVKVFPGFFPRLDRPGAYIRLRHLNPDTLRL